MTDSHDSRHTDDPYDLSRFVQAQENDYEQALNEIREGRKRTHWMWYVFPQVDGLAVDEKRAVRCDTPLAAGKIVRRRGSCEEHGTID